MNILAIDLNRLNEELDRCTIMHPATTPYVICSKETQNIIASKCLEYERLNYCSKFNVLKSSNGLIAQYQGCRMLIDDSLKIGEVKIR